MKIRHIESEEDRHELADMLAKAYARSYVGYYDQFFRRICTFPNVDFRNNRVLEVDGRIVAHVRVIPKVMRVGKTKLRVAGIGAVGTHPRHQKKGYMAALLPHTLRYIADEGYDMALLFGIADFYHRFGFASAAAGHETVLSLNALPTAFRGVGWRRFRPADLPAVIALYKRYGMWPVGGMERDEAYFRYEEGRWANYWLVTERRQPIGYVEIEPSDVPAVVECALPEREDVYARVLTECGKMARERLSKEIRLLLPAGHPLAEYCEMLGCRRVAEWRRNAGAMARLICFESWARKMCDEWSARLAASQFRDADAALTLECDLGRVGLSIKRGKVALSAPSGRRPVRTDQRVLAQLTAGYRTVQNAQLMDELDASERDAALLAAMFPRQPAWVWPSDRF